MPLSSKIVRPSRVLGVLALLILVGLTSCVRPAPPAPAEQRTTAPPWPAPRDGISYIDAAGLEQLPLDITDNQRVLEITISIDGQPVELAPYIGIDRVRALQAPVHTHDSTGTVWLEGRGADEVTLAKFFTVWGVRMTDRCLGAACGTLEVEVDGAPAAGDPGAVRFVDAQTIDITLTTKG